MGLTLVGLVGSFGNTGNKTSSSIFSKSGVDVLAEGQEEGEGRSCGGRGGQWWRGSQEGVTRGAARAERCVATLHLLKKS